MVDQSICPDVITYTTVINAFAQQANIEKAEEVFEMMFQDYNDYGNEAARPDEAAFNALVNGLAIQQDVIQKRKHQRMKRQRDRTYKGDPRMSLEQEKEELDYYHSPERAEKILKRMEDLCSNGYLDFQPSVWVYSSVLKTWAKSGRWDAPEKARSVLDRMNDLYVSGRNPSVRPNNISYNIVIDSFAKAGKPKEAEALLRELSESYEARLVEKGPNLISYTSVITAYGRIKNKYWIQANKAEAVLREMQKLGDPSLRPEIIAWTALIDVYAKACIFGGEKSHVPPMECLERCMDLLDEMIKENVEPNIVTYNTVIKAMAFSKHEFDREKYRDRVVALMKERGVEPQKYTISVLSKIMTSEQQRK